MTDQSHSFLTEADRAALANIEHRATVRQIASQVCAETGTSYAEVMGSNRAACLCRVREVIYYMATREGFSSPQIGRVFRRDHTTILSGLRNEQKRRGEA